MSRNTTRQAVTPDSGNVSMTVKADVEQFRRLFSKSSDVDKKLKTALRKNIRTAANAAVQASVQEVLGSYGTVAAEPKHTGLRQKIAAGIKVKVMTGARAGVTITASSSNLPENQKALVRAWEIGSGSAKGWRHPVFGTQAQITAGMGKPGRGGHGRDWVWVTQTGHPFFRLVIFNRKDTIRKAVESAMSEALKSLEGP